MKIGDDNKEDEIKLEDDDNREDEIKLEDDDNKGDEIKPKDDAQDLEILVNGRISSEWIPAEGDKVGHSRESGVVNVKKWARLQGFAAVCNHSKYGAENLARLGCNYTKHHTKCSFQMNIRTNKIESTPWRVSKINNEHNYPLVEVEVLHDDDERGYKKRKTSSSRCGVCRQEGHNRRSCHQRSATSEDVVEHEIDASWCRMIQQPLRYLAPTLCSQPYHWRQSLVVTKEHQDNSSLRQTRLLKDWPIQDPQPSWDLIVSSRPAQVHVSLLESFHNNTIPGRQAPPPPPIEVEGEIECEVEFILVSRL
ncbi:hypothetical protein BGZ49_001780 [Haplosporangium sp. Z 27]|nr:hypothetical protein BGZ49_001780 [Haplosporangium sp. Z 27]